MKNKANIEYNKRRAASCNTSAFCHLAKDNSFIEVTEWTSGEGWDVTIDDKSFSITFGELEALNYLIKTIDIYHEVN